MMNKKLYVPHRPFRTNLYVTYFCDLACDHCLSRCDPGRSKDVLPISDSLFYIDEFRKKSGMFSKIILLSGGESTSVYFNHSNDYLPTLISEILKRKCNMGIHTNSVWATSKKADLIWNDLISLGKKYRTGINLGLSCDVYHNNLDGLYESLKILSNPAINNKRIYPWIMSFKDDLNVKKLQGHISEKYPDMKIKYSLDDGVSKIGRALDNNLGKDFYEYINFSSDIIISLYPDKTASIGSCHTGERHVSYVNPDNTMKPLEQLYPEMVEKYIECFAKNKFNSSNVTLLKQYLIPTSQR